MELKRWIACYSALFTAAMLIVVSIMAWPAVPMVAIGALMVALAVLFFALWNYNQARFPERGPSFWDRYFSVPFLRWWTIAFLTEIVAIFGLWVTGHPQAAQVLSSFGTPIITLTFVCIFLLGILWKRW
jgi:hypothetical protein